jgi:protein SCO1/2
MIALATILALLLGAATEARAGFTAGDLQAIAAAPSPDAALPLALSFRDDDGRARTLADALGGKPTVLIFADYTCHTLCGPIIDFTAAALRQSGLRPGADFRLIVIGIDPKDGIGAARAMRTARIGNDDPIAAAAVFLTGDESAIHAVTAALGYRYAYDAAHDQYAHPAAAYVLDSRGAVARVLSGLGLSGTDMRLALVGAGHGQVGTFADHIRLLCYGYDAVRGIFTERITLFLQIGVLATVAALAGSIALMVAKTRRGTSRKIRPRGVP